MSLILLPIVIFLGVIFSYSKLSVCKPDFEYMKILYGLQFVFILLAIIVSLFFYFITFKRMAGMGRMKVLIFKKVKYILITFLVCWFPFLIYLFFYFFNCDNIFFNFVSIFFYESIGVFNFLVNKCITFFFFF